MSDARAVGAHHGPPTPRIVRCVDARYSPSILGGPRCRPNELGRRVRCGDVVGFCGVRRRSRSPSEDTGQGVSRTLPEMCSVDLAMKAFRASASGYTAPT
jgi:hypothetical protein